MAERTDLTNAIDADVEIERSVDDIRRDIVNRRESISDTVERLGDHIQQRLDWREYLADHPIIAIGAAAGAGLLLSGLLKRRQSPKERIFGALAEGFQDITGDITGQFRGPLGVLHGRRGIKQRVRGAAINLVAEGIANSLRNRFQRVH
jgi:ElaB/YqjD/DUF883 family membrane-anchored ribosome-binding protein